MVKEVWRTNPEGRRLYDIFDEVMGTREKRLRKDRSHNWQRTKSNTVEQTSRREQTPPGTCMAVTTGKNGMTTLIIIESTVTKILVS